MDAGSLKGMVGLRCKVHIVDLSGVSLFYEGVIEGLSASHLVFVDKFGMRHMWPVLRVESVQEVKKVG